MNIASVNSGKSGSRQIWSVWGNFMLAGIFFVSPIFLAMILRPIFLALFCASLTLFAFFVIRNLRPRHTDRCYFVPYIVARLMFHYTLILLVFDIVVVMNGGLRNQTLLPDFLVTMFRFPILILAPLLAANTLAMILRKHRCIFCTICWMSYGFPRERGYLMDFLSKEMLRIMRQLFVAAMILSLIGWSYFWVSYDDAKISVYDALIFVWTPMFVWLIHSIALWIRCFTVVLFENRMHLNTLFRKGEICCRCIVVCDDRILQKKDDKTGIFDTPVLFYMPFDGVVDPKRVVRELRRIYGIRHGEIRQLYFNVDRENNCAMLHLVAFLRSSADVDVSGDWLETLEIITMFQHRRISPYLRNELFRIRTSIVAKQSYLPDGQRREDIKNAGFTFDKIKDADIDYSNPKWLFVAMRNVDNPMNIAKFIWVKFFEGQTD